MQNQPSSLYKKLCTQIVYYFCDGIYGTASTFNLLQFKDLWADFAEDGIANCAVPHRNKSLLSWKDLYLNSLLWNNIKSATISKMNEIEKLSIKSIDVYKGNYICFFVLLLLDTRCCIIPMEDMIISLLITTQDFKEYSVSQKSMSSRKPLIGQSDKSYQKKNQLPNSYLD